MLPSTAKSLSQGRESGLDATSIAAPWASTRSSAAAGAILLLTVKSNTLELLSAHPSGGFAALRAALAPASDKVVYGAFPFTRGGLQRFAFFTCVGSGVGGVAKGRVSLQKSGVARALEGCAGEVFWGGGVEEVSEATAMEALAALPGAGDVVLL